MTTEAYRAAKDTVDHIRVSTNIYSYLRAPDELVLDGVYSLELLRQLIEQMEVAQDGIPPA